MQQHQQESKANVLASALRQPGSGLLSGGAANAPMSANAGGAGFMHGLNAQIERTRSDGNALIQKLEGEVQTEHSRVVALRDFLTRIQLEENCNAFDSQDVEATTSELNAANEKLQQLQRELSIKREFFETQLSNMRGIILRRQQVINEANAETGFLAHNGSLTKKLADKQVNLIALASKTAEQLGNAN